MNIEDIRFLVVEDQGFQRWVTGNMLEGLGAKHVYSAADGRAALDLLAELNPPVDIVISDLDMPGMDGMEFIRHVGESSSSMSLIVASALDRSLVATVETMARAYGVNLLGTLEKPATAKKLKGLIDAFEPAAERRKAVFEEMSAAEIVEGLRAGQFEPFFQPKVDMLTERVKGAEANARWRHPAKGLIAPGSFISVLEVNGLIDDLTETLLRIASASCRQWRAAGMDMTVSVNLSLTMLSDTTLADRMRSVVESQDLDPRHVVFEVTESAAAANLAKALENLSRLRMKGFGLSIDDFGTGYSSMERLARVPFTELKIDRTFVHNAHERESSRAMLESSLDVARKLKITAVAEGVENREQWEVLRDLGCPQAQGYYVAKPMDARDFGAWLRERREVPA